MTEIRQYAPNGQFTLVPRARRRHLVRKNKDNTYITGLTKEQEERIGKKIGEDLSNLSDYWATYPIEFYMPQLFMNVNEETPEGELFITVAKANKLLAEDEDELINDPILKRNTVFYINDVQKKHEKQVKLTEVKDEVSHLIYNMRNDKDKMLFICYKLGKFVTDTMKADSLYSTLSQQKERYTKMKQFEDFKSVLKSSNEELQAFYYVKQGLKISLILFDKDSKQYKFQENAVGSTEEKVVKFFSEKKNELLLAALINEIQDRKQ